MKKLFLLALLFFTVISWSQTTSTVGVWLDHLPYGNGVDVVQEGQKVYVAVEQGIFILDLQDRDLQRLSKLNGLSDVGITAMAYSESRDEIIIGYENSNMDVIAGEQVYNIPDITLSANYPGLKTINHLYTSGDLVYISTDFGIVVLDLDQRIIRETYIIGPGGADLQVNQVVIEPPTNKIYAATTAGIFSASLDSELQFFLNWNKDPKFDGNIRQVTYFNDEIIVNKAGNSINDSIFRLSNGQWHHIPELGTGLFDFMRAKDNVLALCNNFQAQGFDTTFTLQYNINAFILDVPRYNPTAAVVDDNPESFWSVDETKGLYLNFQEYTNQHFLPNSPASKAVFKMTVAHSRLYVAPGAMDATWTPQYSNLGFYLLHDFHWTNFSYLDFEKYLDIVAIAADPEDPTHFYASSYGSGILEFKDNELVGIINSTTVGKSNLPGINGGDNHRVGGFSYDEEGNLWFPNPLTDNVLGVIRPDGSVESFSLGSVVNSSDAIRDIMYTSEDQIWLQTRSAGIAVVRLDNGVVEAKKLQASEGQGNLPTETVLSFAEDKDGEVWIGTNQGVAILYSPQNIFEPNRNYDAQRIIIDEDGDGLGEPFLGGESVNDIEVDGSNKKWFATGNSGVFYTSEDGREEIFHFTTANSPLLSNNVIDIAIDGQTGMVYFGTDQGIVSFQNVATEGSDFNEDVYAYPNPVEPGYEGPILIRGLVTNAQVKITDIEGNIVYETVAEGGQAIWSGRRFDGQRAKTGVYLAYITDDLGSSTAVAKILIVN